jgi:hypothetical protein
MRLLSRAIGCLVLVCWMVFIPSIVKPALAQTASPDVNIGAYNPLGIAGWQAGDLIYYGSNGYFTRLPIGSTGQVLEVSAGLPSWQTGGGGGGLTSVGLQWDNVLYPTAFPNSPLTANGTLGPPTLKSQSANTLFGNFTSSSAAPTFSTASVNAGTGLSGGGNVTTNPTISLSTPVAVANGGTGAATVANHLFFGNHSGSTAAPGFIQPAYADIMGLGTAAPENLSSVIVDNGSGALTIGSGQVTGGMIASSVALAGSPTTTTQTAGTNNTTIATTAFVIANALTNPMTTKGDIIYESGTPAPTRLAIGNSGDILGIVSGVPAWTCDQSVIIGNGAVSTGGNGVSIGVNAATAGQYAVAIAINSSASQIGGVALGVNASSSATNAMAFGANAVADASNSFALGANSTTNGVSNIISCGTAGTYSSYKRVSNMADGSSQNDAVSVEQLGSWINHNISTATTGVTGNSYFATATLTFTLPDATLNPGKSIAVINNGAAITITYDTTSSQTINGSASGALTNTSRYQWDLFTNDGANWYRK